MQIIYEKYEVILLENNMYNNVNSTITHTLVRTQQLLVQLYPEISEIGIQCRAIPTCNLACNKLLLRFNVKSITAVYHIANIICICDYNDITLHAILDAFRSNYMKLLRNY